MTVLETRAANSDIEARQRDTTEDFIQGFTSKETNESAAANSGQPALIQSTSFHN